MDSIEREMDPVAMTTVPVSSAVKKKLAGLGIESENLFSRPKCYQISDRGCAKNYNTSWEQLTSIISPLFHHCFQP